MLLRLHHIAHIADGFNLLPAIAKLVPERLYEEKNKYTIYYDSSACHCGHSAVCYVSVL